MSNDIPDDIMETARKVHLEILGWGIGKTVGAIAQALMAERDAATKAERERCAERFEIAATELGRQECCGFAAPDHECCADPLYMISDRDGARAIRNGADFVPAAAIRKGDGE